MTLHGRLVALAVLVALIGRPGVPGSLALLGDTETADATVTTATSFDVAVPTIKRSVVAKTGQYAAGFVRAGGTYHVYAEVVDEGTITTGVAQVTADVSSVSAAAGSVTLAAGAYIVGGVSYGYRSAALAADAGLPEGTQPYSVTAIDGAGNTASRTNLTVAVDNTRPAGVDVQTVNGTGTAGKPDLGDRLTLTFTEPIDPASVLAGWNGDVTATVVRITDGGVGAADSLTVRNASNSAALPLGTVGLGGLSYVSANRDFGATGTASTIQIVGSTIVVTLGTPSGTTGTQLVGTTMSWTPSATSTDRAGNACMTTAVSESTGGVADVDF